MSVERIEAAIEAYQAQHPGTDVVPVPELARAIQDYLDAHPAPDEMAGVFARKEDLPTFAQILDRARAAVSDAMDWLRSDWSDDEIGMGQGKCRAEAVVALSRAKSLIDRAKG